MTSPLQSFDVFKWFEAFGIWFTAFVALFLPVLYRPKLRVFAKPAGIGSTTYVTIDGGGWIDEELWFKIGVNNPSTLNAEDVQVRLIFARERGRNDRSAFRMFSSWWLKVSALPLTEISIPPKYIQYIDLCYLQVTGGTNEASLFLVAVRPPVRDWKTEKESIESAPNLRLDPLIEYDLVLAVSGRNTRASYWRMRVKWTPPVEGTKRLHGEGALRRAVVIGQPTKVARHLELENPATLARTLE